MQKYSNIIYETDFSDEIWFEILIRAREIFLKS